MAAKAQSSTNGDISAGTRDFSAQFHGLDRNDPSSWPAAPKYLLYLAVALVVLGALWYFWLKGMGEDLDAARAQEVQLRKDYQTKVQRAVSLEELRKQKELVQQYVTLLEKQLPGKAEMDALLSDVNQAGLGRNLQFELFRPAPLVVHDYYAEQPIALKVTGDFNSIGAFTADIANMSRIVTLNNINVYQSADKNKAGVLVMEAVAKTFRYLDPDDIAKQKAATQKGKKK